MNEDKKISVIVPVYNVEKYVADCIESVLKQTYHNFELILVNDGSSDHSADIINKFVITDDRIILLEQVNKGVAAARNNGMAHATGEFITFIDSDDWVATDYLEHLIYLQSLEDVDMCMTTSFFVKQRDKQADNIKIETISPEDATALLLSPKVVVGSCNKLYRREWIEKNNIRQNETLFSGEGLNFIVLAAQYANKVTISNKKIYFYRRNVLESATTKFNIKMFTNNEQSLNLIEKESKIKSEKINVMIDLFRAHLRISGVLAILNYADISTYPEEYYRWRKEIRHSELKLLSSKIVPIKSKIRIIGFSISPRIWAKLALNKRKKIFRESV